MPKKVTRRVAIVGSKRQVLSGTADKTSGGLKACDLMVNKRGTVVSKKQHAHGLKMASNLRPRTAMAGRRKMRGGEMSAYSSAGGNIFDDIVGGIGKVVDTGMKLAPAIAHFI